MTKIKTKARYYFTFGAGQLLAAYFVSIEADTAEGAREAILEQFGRCWSFQYDEERWAESYPRYFVNLTEIGPLESSHHHERRAIDRTNEASRHWAGTGV